MPERLEVSLSPANANDSANAEYSMPNLRRLINEDYSTQSHLDHGPYSIRSSQVGQSRRLILNMPAQRESSKILSQDGDPRSSFSQSFVSNFTATPVQKQPSKALRQSKLNFVQFSQLLLDQSRIANL